MATLFESFVRTNTLVEQSLTAQSILLTAMLEEFEGYHFNGEPVELSQERVNDILEALDFLDEVTTKSLNNLDVLREKTINVMEATS